MPRTSFDSVTALAAAFCTSDAAPSPAGMTPLCIPAATTAALKILSASGSAFRPNSEVRKPHRARRGRVLPARARMPSKLSEKANAAATGHVRGLSCSRLTTHGVMTRRAMVSPLGIVSRSRRDTTCGSSQARWVAESSGWSSPDGYVVLALAREGVTAPIPHPLLELESRELSHQVALGRPDVAKVVRAVADDAVAATPIVVGRALLRRRVQGVEADVVLSDVERHGILPRRQPADGRYRQLDYEPTARRELARRVAKAGDLLGLGAKVADAVPHAVDQRELPWYDGRRHVADGHRDVRALLAQLLGHRR